MEAADSSINRRFANLISSMFYCVYYSGMAASGKNNQSLICIKNKREIFRYIIFNYAIRCFHPAIAAPVTLRKDASNIAGQPYSRIDLEGLAMLYKNPSSSFKCGFDGYHWIIF